MASPEERYAALCEAFVGNPDVSQPSATGSKKTFGSSTLRIRDRIFAMLVKGRLVVKLPARRVDALIASGAGQRYAPRPGRFMKEWLSLEPASSDETWLSLAREAMEFGSRG
jgi:hypothetical protein